MHNLYAIFVKILDICKKFSYDLVDAKGNIRRPGTKPRFSDLEVVSLNLTMESLGIDSENFFFVLLQGYKKEIPNLISRRQFNDRRKFTYDLCASIRERVANDIDGGEEYFCIDSMPVVVCQLARGNRCKMGKDDYEKAPSFGYCASQKMHYYGYKLHAVCGLGGVIHSFDLTKANVHDIKYLQDVKYEFHDCSIFGDKGYIGAEVQQDLFETANIRMEVPYRLNQKDWKPTFIPFAKARKRIETSFSQIDEQFMMIRNYAKDVKGLFTRVLGKITGFTVLQYLNKVNGRPIGRVKYALL